jgi:signal transduction histidine kinase
MVSGRSQRFEDLVWGSHFCCFHDSAEDLKDSVIQYFQAGLDDRQRCLWITSAPLKGNEARALLAAGVRDLDRLLSSGQVEIIDQEIFRAHEHTLEVREDRARAAGYSGLRVALHPSSDRASHQNMVGAPLRGRRIVALCSYPLAECSGPQVIDVVGGHDFALVRREGAWEEIESASPRARELEEALRVRDDFLSLASHELKTPLAALQLYLDGVRRLLRRDDFDPEEVSRRIGRSLERCDRLGHLLDNLLDVSRMRSGRLSTHPESVDLSAVIRSICDRLRELAARDEHAFVLDLPPELRCSIDTVRIEQILSNLISNVLKHAPGSPIYVTMVARGEDRLTISVRDEGPGIPPENQQRIFEQFGRTAERYSGGLALGLWISKQVVEALDGTIRVVSAAGKGTELIVDLPRHKSQIGEA